MKQKGGCMNFGRTELDNFDVDNAWDIIDLFEQKIANFCGSPYAVSVDNCTNALFLCLKYIDKPQTITIPNRTYVSVPNTILNAGYKVKELVIYPGKSLSDQRHFKRSEVWNILQGTVTMETDYNNMKDSIS